MDTVVRIGTFAYKYHFSFSDFGVVNSLDEPERDLYIIHLIIAFDISMERLKVIYWQRK